jgi:predicted polyphosphate/ATP-dependent NAD kinase
VKHDAVAVPATAAGGSDFEDCRTSRPRSIRLGLVVNPIAGMGGRVGLHGTDGSLLASAIAAGAYPSAPTRMRRALTQLARLVPVMRVAVAGGPMGADLLPAGWSAETVWCPLDPTTADDTRRTVESFLATGVDLVLFGGGDGTARDVSQVLGGRIPVLGVPCGVKMHSAVFATTPETAARTVAWYLNNVGRTASADVLDVTPDGLHAMGTASVPALRDGLQRGKALCHGGVDLPGLGRAIARRMQPGRLYLLGPGTTVAHVNSALGLPAAPAGVDAVLDGRLVATDVSEEELLALLDDHPWVTLILGVVGGQGFVLGRGNQQLSPDVLAAIGPENIEIMASAEKIALLDPPVLRIDLDDRQVAARLTGYRRVHTAPGRSTVMKVIADGW